jgi:hypothetical protein
MLKSRQKGFLKFYSLPLFTPLSFLCVSLFLSGLLLRLFYSIPWRKRALRLFWLLAKQRITEVFLMV